MVHPVCSLKKNSSTVIACAAVLLPCSLSLQGLHVPCGAQALLGLFDLRDDHCPFLNAAPRMHCKVFWALNVVMSVYLNLRCQMAGVICSVVLTIWPFSPLWCADCATAGAGFPAGHAWRTTPALLAVCTISLTQKVIDGTAS